MLASGILNSWLTVELEARNTVKASNAVYASNVSGESYIGPIQRNLTTKEIYNE